MGWQKSDSSIEVKGQLGEQTSTDSDGYITNIDKNLDGSIKKVTVSFADKEVSTQYHYSKLRVLMSESSHISGIH